MTATRSLIVAPLLPARVLILGLLLCGVASCEQVWGAFIDKGVGDAAATASDAGFEVGLLDPGLDPESLFNNQVKPEMTKSCSCHSIGDGWQDSTFLAANMEYLSITTYEGGKFLTATPDQSLLLQKGKHRGPALTVDQTRAVRGWLSTEAVTRGNGIQSPTTPTVPIRQGDFFVSLQSLTGDPQASITFSLTPVIGTTYRIRNMQLNAGPTAGISIKHPRVILFTAAGATSEGSDGLSMVDLTINANQSAPVDSGSLLLTDLSDSSTRLAFAFQLILSVNPTMAMPSCKNLMGFSSKVQPDLARCASLCHSASANEPRKTQATNSFDMASANSTDQKVVSKLCVSTLARVNPNNPSASILILQPAPQSLGGTPNHPYKMTDASSFSTFQSAVLTWVESEK